MGQIKVEKNVGGIEGLCVIEPAVHGDARGYFMETYNEKDMKEAGMENHSSFINSVLCVRMQKPNWRIYSTRMKWMALCLKSRMTRGLPVWVSLSAKPVSMSCPSYGIYSRET